MTLFELDFLYRLAIQVVFLVALARLSQRCISEDEDVHLGGFMLGNVTFLVSYWLKGQSVSLGFAFGLFAIFSIFRYRAESVSLVQITLLFIAIGSAVLNAASPLPPISLALLDALLLILLGFSRSRVFRSPTRRIELLYDASRLADDHRLLEDIHRRTGLDVQSVRIREIDFLHDTARLEIRYRPP